MEAQGTRLSSLAAALARQPPDPQEHSTLSVPLSQRGLGYASNSTAGIAAVADRRDAAVRTLKWYLAVPWDGAPVASPQRDALERLWRCHMRNAVFEPKSPAWQLIGFQGPDPGTDVRGGGELAVRVCSIIAELGKSEAVRRSDRQAAAPPESSYPVYSVAINLVVQLARLLRLDKGSTIAAMEEDFRLDILVDSSCAERVEQARTANSSRFSRKAKRTCPTGESFGGFFTIFCQPSVPEVDEVIVGLTECAEPVPDGLSAFAGMVEAMLVLVDTVFVEYEICYMNMGKLLQCANDAAQELLLGDAPPSTVKEFKERLLDSRSIAKVAGNTKGAWSLAAMGLPSLW